MKKTLLIGGGLAFLLWLLLRGQNGSESPLARFLRAPPLDVPGLDLSGRRRLDPADYGSGAVASSDVTGGVLPACAGGCGTRSWRVEFGSAQEQAATFARRAPSVFPRSTPQPERTAVFVRQPPPPVQRYGGGIPFFTGSFGGPVPMFGR